MKRHLVVGAFVICLVAGLVLVAGPVAAGQCEAVDLSHLDRPGVARLVAAAEPVQWVELGATLVVCGPEETVLGRLPSTRVVDRVEGVGDGDLWISRGFSRAELELAGWRVVAWQDGRAVVVRRPDAVTLSTPEHGCRRPAMAPAGAREVLLRDRPRGPGAKATTFGPEVAGLVASVTPSRWESDVATLVSWNRWSGHADRTDVRDWLVDQLEAVGSLEVTTEPFTMFVGGVGSITVWNVTGVLDGVSRPDEWYVIGGHADAISESSAVAAPGAEDNASGCAGVLEMARVLAAQPSDATLVFTCYYGEEQGLEGSEHQVALLQSTGDLDKVAMMLNMDMIAFTSDVDLDVLLETAAFAADRLTTMEDAASQYTSLRTVTSLSPYGSDHIPFISNDVDAVLTIENDWAEYSHYHTTNDTVDKLTTDMAVEILKMNVATIAHLAGADTPVIFTDGLEGGTTDRWSQVVGGT